MRRRLRDRCLQKGDVKRHDRPRDCCHGGSHDEENVGPRHAHQVRSNNHWCLDHAEEDASRGSQPNRARQAERAIQDIADAPAQPLQDAPFPEHR